MSICKEKDDFIDSKEMWEAHWRVDLNNGEQVYDDDGRRNEKDQPMISSWLRLKEYCDEHKLWITSMYLRFRSHYEHITPNADGYFMKKGGLASPGMPTHHYLIVGVVEQHIINVNKWKIPELIVEEEDTRKLKNNLEWTILKKS